jgi:hypothetical protein
MVGEIGSRVVRAPVVGVRGSADDPAAEQDANGVQQRGDSGGHGPAGQIRLGIGRGGRTGSGGGGVLHPTFIILLVLFVNYIDVRADPGRVSPSSHRHSGRDRGRRRHGPAIASARADGRRLELVHGGLPPRRKLGQGDGGLNRCMGFLPTRSQVRALTGSGIERFAATQARFYADAGGWTLNTRIRREQPPRRGLPGFGCAMSAVK